MSSKLILFSFIKEFDFTGKLLRDAQCTFLHALSCVPVVISPFRQVLVKQRYTQSGASIRRNKACL